MSTTRLIVDGTALEVTVTRKRVKNVNARLRGTRLLISAPPGVAQDRLQDMIQDLALKLVRRARAHEVSSAADSVELARKVAARFPEPPRVADLRFVATQRQRWGSYSARTGIVRLNLALTRMPRWVLEAVLAHELAHAFHCDHSREFWALLRRVCPKTDQARAFLRGVCWLSSALPSLSSLEREQLAMPQAGDDGDD